MVSGLHKIFMSYPIYKADNSLNSDKLHLYRFLVRSVNFCCFLHLWLGKILFDVLRLLFYVFYFIAAMPHYLADVLRFNYIITNLNFFLDLHMIRHITRATSVSV